MLIMRFLKNDIRFGLFIPILHAIVNCDIIFNFEIKTFPIASSQLIMQLNSPCLVNYYT